jgi:multidrug efflux pump subunit AcrA (membrane-fusion protein)
LITQVEEGVFVAERRRIPGLGVVVVGLLVLLPLGAVGWWMNRPTGDTPPIGPGLGELDVVCIGRVDGLTPVAGLEPAMPGQVQEVYVVDGQAVKAGDKLLKLNDESLKLRAEEAKEAVAAAQIELDAAELELKLYPLRMNSQKIAVDAANDRVTLAKQLLKERELRRPLIGCRSRAG